MLLISTLQSIFSSLAILSSLFVITTNNPVFCALFLVLSFCNVSCLLFFLQLDFVPITFLVVYVGAIMVLFLFVLMMLNIKLVELKYEKLHYFPLVFSFVIVLVIELLFLVCSEFTALNSGSVQQLQFFSDIVSISTHSSEFCSSIFNSTNIRTVGQLLFSDYKNYFIIVGIILLLAMISAITATLNKKFITKSQAIHAQVLRSFSNSVVKF
jgi:NADH:ubiquinone oxidoreductase subunit 6 (subunit J)